MEELGQRLKGHNVQWLAARCGSKADVLAVLERLAGMAKVGVQFVLHVVSHGSDEGLWVKATGEDIHWPELAPYLERMNRNMAGGLILNMTTCYGLHGIKVVNPDAAALPVYGVIGAKEDLDVVDAAR